MDDDREDDVFVQFELDEETVAHLQRRAEAAGRTLEQQIRYELKVNRGMCPPDPGDVEATQRGQLFRRMFAHTPLNG